MKRILALALVAAIAIPSVAVAAAATDDPALAQERYYSSYGGSGPIEPFEPAPAQPRAVAAESGDSGGWKLVAIGAGALVLVLGAAELVTLGRLRAVRAG